MLTCAVALAVAVQALQPGVTVRGTVRDRDVDLWADAMERPPRVDRDRRPCRHVVPRATNLFESMLPRLPSAGILIEF